MVESQELVRVSHAEREGVASSLRYYVTEGYLTIEEFGDRVSLAYASRTRAELAAATDGLPEPVPATPETIRAEPRRRASGWSVAIFSGFNRNGRWRVDRNHRILSIFGGGRLDMRDAEFVAPVTAISCLTIFGGVKVIVPEDVEIDLSGISIFGSRTTRTTKLPEPGANRVHLRAVAIFGGVHAVAGS